MPHNFVIVAAGRAGRGRPARRSAATQPGVAERQLRARSRTRSSLASRLLQPRESQKLSFTAPKQPGVYPYVCTYPGHWRRMYGALYVVEDLDDYLADPEAYLAKHPLPIKDDLLKFNRPRNGVEVRRPGRRRRASSKRGRSFANGKQIFQVATCVACHKLDGRRQRVRPRPDASSTPKLQPADILKDILEPSAKINEKYQTYIFELESGKIVTGLILEETPTVIKVIENPLAKTDADRYSRMSEIAGRKKSPTSIMPKGLLDKLTREEILDLVAFVYARGKKDHAMFKAGSAHAGHQH